MAMRTDYLLLPAECSPFLEPAAPPVPALPTRPGVPAQRRPLGRGPLAEHRHYNHARTYAQMAQISATQARLDAIAAGKSAAEARAAGEEAFKYALDLAKREEEQRQRLG
ncbi:hypothetical protein [Kitasatospora griseola]|uniref:hypothetical protein n=1 Tax=Kitasatospora griseola TaxID=2064 RepID=UPI0037F88A12